jgi:hypothetical protein
MLADAQEGGRCVSNPFNALYERPAILALAGEVCGLRVLDAGCGAGVHAAELDVPEAVPTSFALGGLRKRAGGAIGRDLVRFGWANVIDMPLFACPDSVERPPSVAQARCSVRTATDDVGVVVVLAVVLPEAHRTDLESATLAKCEVAAARTHVRPMLRSRRHRVLREPARVLVEPTRPIARPRPSRRCLTHRSIVPPTRPRTAGMLLETDKDHEPTKAPSPQ